jgi:cytochrome c-type biogenesis protein
VHRLVLDRVAGVLFLLLAIVQLEIVSLPGWAGKLKVPNMVRLPESLRLGLLGAFFAISWTPCIGPIVAGVLYLASTTGSSYQGAILLAVYSMGFAVPFLVTAGLMGGVWKLLARLRPLVRTVAFLNALLLFVFAGVLLAGKLNVFLGWLAIPVQRLPLDWVNRYL